MGFFMLSGYSDIVSAGLIFGHGFFWQPGQGYLSYSLGVDVVSHPPTSPVSLQVSQGRRVGALSIKIFVPGPNSFACVRRWRIWLAFFIFGSFRTGCQSTLSPVRTQKIGLTRMEWSTSILQVWNLGHLVHIHFLIWFLSFNAPRRIRTSPLIHCR